MPLEENFEILGVTEHDNYVFFSGATNLSYHETGHSITPGQPYDGINCGGDECDVKAGRKNSAGPAADFKNGLSVTNMIAAEKMLDQMPADLNFVTFGSMTFTFGSKKFTCPDFRIAQGNYSSNNNWWIGSTDC